jgi:hypothetical protein
MNIIMKIKNEIEEKREVRKRRKKRWMSFFLQSLRIIQRWIIWNF